MRNETLGSSRPPGPMDRTSCLVFDCAAGMYHRADPRHTISGSVGEPQILPVRLGGRATRIPRRLLFRGNHDFLRERGGEEGNRRQEGHPPPPCRGKKFCGPGTFASPFLSLTVVPDWCYCTRVTLLYFRLVSMRLVRSSTLRPHIIIAVFSPLAAR